MHVNHFLQVQSYLKGNERYTCCPVSVSIQLPNNLEYEILKRHGIHPHHSLQTQKTNLNENEYEKFT